MILGFFKDYGNELTSNITPPVVEEKKDIPNEPSEAELLELHVTKLSGYFESNLELVALSIPHIKKNLHTAIASSSAGEEVTYTKLYTMLLGIWTEGRLHKLVYEKGAFNDCERVYIYSGNNLEEKWHKALEIAFRKFRGVELEIELTSETLGFTHFNIYNEMKGWITSYISPVISLRNRVAHGQWKHPFSNDTGEWSNSFTFKISEQLSTKFYKENYLTVECKFHLVQDISVAINNLAVNAEEYKTGEFDDMYAKVQKQVEKLELIDKKEFIKFKNFSQEGFKKKEQSLKKKQEELIAETQKLMLEQIKKEYTLTPKS